MCDAARLLFFACAAAGVVAQLGIGMVRHSEWHADPPRLPCATAVTPYSYAVGLDFHRNSGCSTREGDTLMEWDSYQLSNSR